MRAIFSYWQSSDYFFCDIQMAKLSNDFAKKCGYKTCLYTDDIGYKLLHNIDYDDIVIFSKKTLNEFYPKIWSLGKILAMSLVKEPFIHLDFDLFLFKSLNYNLVKSDFFSLYFEPWMGETKVLQDHCKKVFDIYPDKKNINIRNFDSYNFALVGGNKTKEINTVSNKIIDFAITYKDDLIKLNNQNYNPSWVFPVIFEQILLPNLMLSIFDIKMDTVFPRCQFTNSTDQISIKQISNFLKTNFIKNKIIHLHGEKAKKFRMVKKTI